MRSGESLLHKIQCLADALERKIRFFCGETQNMRFYQIIERQQSVFFVCKVYERYECSAMARRKVIILPFRPRVQGAGRHSHIECCFGDAVTGKLSNIPAFSHQAFSGHTVEMPFHSRLRAVNCIYAVAEPQSSRSRNTARLQAGCSAIRAEMSPDILDACRLPFGLPAKTARHLRCGANCTENQTR